MCLKKRRNWSQPNGLPSWIGPVCPINRCGKKSRSCSPLATTPTPASFNPHGPDGLIANLDGILSSGGLQAGQLFAERFQLVRKLGEGGMGQVWLAEQTSPVRRQVALKLIKAGMYDEAVVQRFQSERQSLAIMDHPAIAKVFDAGATPQGQPYFVMEYVPGCRLRNIAIRRSSRSGTGSNFSSRPAKACSTRTRKPSSIAI